MGRSTAELLGYEAGSSLAAMPSSTSALGVVGRLRACSRSRLMAEFSRSVAALAVASDFSRSSSSMSFRLRSDIETPESLRSTGAPPLAGLDADAAAGFRK